MKTKKEIVEHRELIKSEIEQISNIFRHGVVSDNAVTELIERRRELTSKLSIIDWFLEDN